MTELEAARLHRRCTGCEQHKPRTEFHANSWAPDGLKSKCRSCVNATTRVRKAVNKDRYRVAQREYDSRYREENREEMNKRARERYHTDIEVTRAAERDRYHQNNEAARQAAKVYRDKVPNKTREWALRNKLKAAYGMTVEQYREMEAEQDGVCAICRQPPGKRRLSVDHCHSTGRVRRLLCSTCNSALGLMKENATAIRALAAYAEEWKAETALSGAHDPHRCDPSS